MVHIRHEKAKSWLIKNFYLFLLFFFFFQSIVHPRWDPVDAWSTLQNHAPLNTNSRQDKIVQTIRLRTVVPHQETHLETEGAHLERWY